MTDASEKVPEVDDIDDVPHAGSATAILAEPPHSLYVNLAAREAVNTFMDEERTITVRTVAIVIAAALALVVLLVCRQAGIGIVVSLAACGVGALWGVRMRFRHFEQLRGIVTNDCDPRKMLGVINILLDEDLLAANHTRLQYMRALCLAELGRADEALTQVDMLVAKEGVRKRFGLETLEVRTMAYGQIGDRERLEETYDQARKLLDESRNGSRRQARISMMLELADGRLAFLDKEYDHCRRQLQLVLDASPTPQERTMAEYRLGEVEEATGDVVEASRHYAYAALHGGTLAVQGAAETRLTGNAEGTAPASADVTMNLSSLMMDDVLPEDAL